MKTTTWSDEFLKKTVDFWQPRYGHPLTLEDAREIAGDMTGLFELLNSLDKKYSEATSPAVQEGQINVS